MLSATADKISFSPTLVTRCTLHLCGCPRVGYFGGNPMNTCSRCLTTFTPKLKNKSYCVPCQRQYTKDRNASPHYKKIKKAYNSKPEVRRRRNIYKKVQQAVKSGKIAKLPCEKCSEPKVQAHHEDYSQPLIVTWLCVPCHNLRHMELNAIKGGRWLDQHKPKKPSTIAIGKVVVSCLHCSAQDVVPMYYSGDVCQKCIVRIC